MGRLRRFLSPQLAELIVSAATSASLESHRREITVVFCDLRGFTAFAETAEPEDVMGVLREYHAAMGELIFAHGGTLERFTGDGLMVFFNDPIPCPEPPAQAVRMARGDARAGRRARPGLARGAGTTWASASASPRATRRSGRIGFEGRWDYGAIGSVTNLAARLCGEAEAGQILISERVHLMIEDVLEAEPLGELRPQRFPSPGRRLQCARHPGGRARGRRRARERDPHYVRARRPRRRLMALALCVV